MLGPRLRVLGGRAASRTSPCQGPGTIDMAISSSRRDLQLASHLFSASQCSARRGGSGRGPASGTLFSLLASGETEMDALANRVAKLG